MRNAWQEEVFILAYFITQENRKQKTKEKILNACVVFANHKSLMFFEDLFLGDCSKCTKVARSNPHKDLSV